ncbi:MAG TPA: FkbM family methyltransferase [Gemmatimonadales bacterium]|jgi:FkbM family methyltransferase
MTISESWARRSLRKVRKWLAYQYRVRRRPVVTVAGVQIRVGRHMSPAVERTVSRGLYEQDELRLIGQLLAPDDIVLEVGAGLGLVSAYCARRLGSSRVFAYEANPDLEACIRETYALNQVQPALEMCAVGADAGTVTLYRDRHLWASSVVRQSGRVRPVEVPVKPLSDIVQRVRPTLLIIDVEGAEQELFDHAHLPSVTRIVLEVHEHVIGAAGARHVRSALAAMGFEELPGPAAGGHVVARRVDARRTV